jgi:hypothetical protein
MSKKMGVASAKKRRKLREWTPLPEIRRIAVDPVLAPTSAKRVPCAGNRSQHRAGIGFSGFRRPRRRPDGK